VNPPNAVTATTGGPYPAGQSANTNFPGTNGALNTMIATTMMAPGSDQVQGGFNPGNLRILASLDYAFNQNAMLGARLGYVLFTDPAKASPGAAFAPIHIEARFSYLFGKGALTKPGLSPMLVLALGLGEFDTFVPVRVESTGGAGNGSLPENAWLTAGPLFGAAGVGARWLLAPKVAATGVLKVEGGIGGGAGFLPGIAPELGLQFGL
jgi:hypothetical protein